MDDLTEVHAPGSYENPADERVWTPNRTLVVAARGSFGIVRAVQVGSLAGRNVEALKVAAAMHVGRMTKGVYWSIHVYDGTPWYIDPNRNARDANGIWLWRWKESKGSAFDKSFAEWDHRTNYAPERWTACTENVRVKLADLPLGM